MRSPNRISGRLHVSRGTKRRNAGSDSAGLAAGAGDGAASFLGDGDARLPNPAPKFRILHVIPSLDSAAEATCRAVIEIAAMNAADGMAPSIAFGAPEEDVAALEREWSKRHPAIAFHGFPYTFPSRFQASRPLTDWLSLRGGDFDVLQVHSILSLLSLQVCSVAISANFPYILRPLGSLDPYDLSKKCALKYSVFASWVRRIIAGARFVQCVAQQEAVSLETFGASPETGVLPLPASAPELTGDRSRFRSSLGIGTEDFVFLFLSRLNAENGLESLLPAMKQAAANDPAARLVIAGSGDESFSRQLKIMAAETGLEDRIHFTGFLQGQAKADAFAGSDFFVFPSRFENAGVTVAEALGYGLPALVSDQVHIWQEIVEARAGWVCKCAMPSLAAVMETILKDRSCLRLAASWARSLAREFEPQNLMSRYRAVYENAAASKPAGGDL